jgi:predicted transposase/invertase (TIGR01784 family)
LFDPLNNYLFFKVFGEKGNEVQLLGFINAVLGKTGDDIFTSVEIQENTSFLAEIMGGKSCALDVRARLKNGAMVNIEVQLQNNRNMNRRSLFYLSKEYTRKLKEGEDYKELQNVIAINIVNYDFPATKSFHTCFRLREEAEREIILTDALEIHYINMVKCRKQGKGKLDDPLCRWLTWFDKYSKPEILEEVIKMDAAILTANEHFLRLTMSDEEMDTYHRYMKAQWDRTSEMNNAREEGSQKRDRVIAKNLLAEGASPEFVQKITGLDLETIQKLYN